MKDFKMIKYEDKYIYDNGFSKRVYICQSSGCKSHKLVQKLSGGFSPPYYICDDCGETSYAPSWIDLPDNQLVVQKKDCKPAFFAQTELAIKFTTDIMLKGLRLN